MLHTCSCHCRWQRRGLRLIMTACAPAALVEALCALFLKTYTRSSRVRACPVPYLCRQSRSGTEYMGAPPNSFRATEPLSGSSFA